MQFTFDSLTNHPIGAQLLFHFVGEGVFQHLELLKFSSGGKPPDPLFSQVHLYIYSTTWELGGFYFCSTVLTPTSPEIALDICKNYLCNILLGWKTIRFSYKTPGNPVGKSWKTPGKLLEFWFKIWVVTIWQLDFGVFASDWFSLMHNTRSRAANFKIGAPK